MTNHHLIAYSLSSTSAKDYQNEVPQRLVRYCSVEDATLEGAVCCR